MAERIVTRTKIVKTPHEQEWQIKAYDQHDVRFVEADCFETDKVAAQQTAAAMIVGSSLVQVGEPHDLGEFTDTCNASP